jgi:hypothetical protein
MRNQNSRIENFKIKDFEVSVEKELLQVRVIKYWMRCVCNIGKLSSNLFQMWFACNGFIRARS